MTPKRYASGSVPKADEMSSSKKKGKARATSSSQGTSTQSHCDDHPSQTDAELLADSQKATHSTGLEREEPSNVSPSDELQTITNGLESRSYRLTLEHNNTKHAECQAEKCFAGDLSKHIGCRPSRCIVKDDTWELCQYFNEKIEGPWRICLVEQQPSASNWSEDDRYFHVSCLEAIGVDMAKYLHLQPEHVVHGTADAHLVECHYVHAAIEDWVDYRGRTYDADRYDLCPGYQRALQAHRTLSKCLAIKHTFKCTSRACTCGTPPERPRSSNCTSYKPIRCRLTDVLIDVGRAGRSLPVPMDELRLMPTMHKHRLSLLETRTELSTPLYQQAPETSEDEPVEKNGGKAESKEAVEPEAEPNQNHTNQELPKNLLLAPTAENVDFYRWKVPSAWNLSDDQIRDTILRRNLENAQQIMTGLDQMDQTLWFA